MKATSYKIKKNIEMSPRPMEALENSMNSKYILRLQRNVKYREKRKIIYFLFEKPVSKPVNS